MRGPVAVFGETPVGFAHAAALPRARPQPGAARGRALPRHPGARAHDQESTPRSRSSATRPAARWRRSSACAVTWDAAPRRRDVPRERRRRGATSATCGGSSTRCSSSTASRRRVDRVAGARRRRTAQRGNDAELLRAGTPLLVDIFPGRGGGGSFSDLTAPSASARRPSRSRSSTATCTDAFRTGMTSLRVGRARVQRLAGGGVRPVRVARARARCARGRARGRLTCTGSATASGLAVHEPPRLGGPPSKHPGARAAHGGHGRARASTTPRADSGRASRTWCWYGATARSRT
jgi:hypothetical protein